MNYQVTHTTTYSGSEPVSICRNEAWLRPRDVIHQTCNNFRLEITPLPSSQSQRTDSFGNNVDTFALDQGYESLTVSAISEIEVLERKSGKCNFSWEDVRDSVKKETSPQGLEIYQFIFESPRIRQNVEFAEYAMLSFMPQRNVIEAGLDLTQRIFNEFTFDSRATTVTTPVEQVFEHKKGVCQDFAHLQISLLRSIGLPARYVSGYLRTLPPPGKPRLIGADATHAWVSLYCGPEAGWIDFDPTNNKPADSDHITVAWGRDYSDVCPLRGVVIGGGKHNLEVCVDVKPIL